MHPAAQHEHREVAMRQQEKEEMRQLVRETVNYMFEHMGLDPSDPTELQQDMAHLRKLRKGSEMVKSVAVKTCLGALLTGLIYLLWDGLRVHLPWH